MPAPGREKEALKETMEVCNKSLLGKLSSLSLLPAHSVVVELTKSLMALRPLCKVSLPCHRLWKPVDFHTSINHHHHYHYYRPAGKGCYLVKEQNCCNASAELKREACGSEIEISYEPLEFFYRNTLILLQITLFHILGVLDIDEEDK